MSEATKRSDVRHPALGPGVWAVLVRNEWFKARHRLAFAVTLAFFAFIHVMETADEVLSARDNDERVYGLPGAWSDMFSEDSILLLIFASIAIIMLVSSEFTWRTARQNVIDGLSKMQWFWGKVILLVLTGLVFVGVKLGIVVGGALIGTDYSAGAPLLPGWVFLALAALFLAYLSAGALALLCSLTIRASGPAMAVWFFWITLGEQLVPGLIQRVVPAAGPVLSLLPFSAAQQVLPSWLYDAAAYERMVASAEAAERTAPEMPNVALLLGVNAGWAVVFIAAAFFFFRRRDL